MLTVKIHVCTGCGSTATDPGRQLQDIWASGAMSCCPERRMVPTCALPTKLAGFLDFVPIPEDPDVPKQLRIDHPKCWQWTGRQNRNGYGRIRWEGKEPVTHRLIWTLMRGPIEDALLLDHRCRNRLCCNPNHLDPVTPKVNTNRGRAKLFKRSEEYVGPTR